MFGVFFLGGGGGLYAQKARSEEYQKESTEGNGFNACDTYALAAAINDTLVTEMEEVRS